MYVSELTNSRIHYFTINTSKMDNIHVPGCQPHAQSYMWISHCNTYVAIQPVLLFKLILNDYMRGGQLIIPLLQPITLIA